MINRLLLIVLSCLLLAACQTAPRPAPGAPVAATDPFWPTDGVFAAKGRTSSWSGFRAKNVERRSLFAQHQAEDRGGIVFVGDSITEGWHTLAQDFADVPVKVVNRGIGGDTTPNLLHRLDADVLALHPRALVVLIGTNDLGEHTAPADIADNLRVFRERVRQACPDIPIAWCLVMPREGKDDYPERIQDLNLRIRRLAAADSNMVVVDTYAALAQADGTSKPEDFGPDRLHLNAAGYGVWLTLLHPVVAGWNLAR